MIVHKNFSLRRFNTFGVEQIAREFIFLKKHSDILDAIQIEGQPWILGGGSNVLLTSDLDTLVLKNELYGRSILKEDDHDICIQFQSGENWHEVVRWTVQQGWGGIENLSLIPGTIGAAPIQNIGAYGVELKDVMISLQAINLTTGKLEEFSNEDCQFGYRDSIFKQVRNQGKYFIQSITLQLSKHPILNTQYADIEKKLEQKNITAPTIQDIHELVIEVRQQKLPEPSKLGNAGSFFKNPIISKALYEQLKSFKPTIPGYVVDDHLIKVPAGWLIDQAGWKGKREGQVGCYERQALVIVNHGGATGTAIWQFAQKVQQDVFEKIGIFIEPEINVWGKDN